MSYIAEYYSRIAELKNAGNTQKETSIRKAFLEMVGKYAKDNNLVVVDELSQDTKNRPDAGLQSEMGLNYGYIENKDSYDDIEKEINLKIAKGYKTDNTIFENSIHLILYQNKQLVIKIRIGASDLTEKQVAQEEFESVIRSFVFFETAEMKGFNEALEKFKEVIPELTHALKEHFKKASQSQTKIFLDDMKFAINKQVEVADVENIVVQHILTKDIFNSIFNDDTLLTHNSIAKSIEGIVATFLTKEQERELKAKIRPYYQIIQNTAHSITDHREKQSFLKTFYEHFYKAYNPDKADRQGIEYTPIDVVSFMVQFTDLLTEKYFDKKFEDKGVEILDPCTGTGIFITEILHEIQHSIHFEEKFKNEIFCNEVDILPYYIANLNIEYTYNQLAKKYKDFDNIILVDTLNNAWGLEGSEIVIGARGNAQEGLFSESYKKAFSENNEKIARQNERPLTVIIGNPPYNANQQNENDNNKNYSYPHIDQRIKNTYIKKSSAQKTKQYDSYKRFIRWASDRMKNDGIISFITNNAYLNAKQDDGFRATITEEFDYAYFVDLKGNSRLNGEDAKKEGGNIFNIRVGVGIMFLVKNGDNFDEEVGKRRCQIKYLSVDDFATKEQKFKFLREMTSKMRHTKALRTFNELSGKFTRITPNKKTHQWLGQVENDWQELVPLITKDCKGGKVGANAIFKLYSLGVATNRDKWVYDLNEANLEKKVNAFIDYYHEEMERQTPEIDRLNSRKKEDKIEETTGVDLEFREFEYALSMKIKWTRLLKKHIMRKTKFPKFNKKFVRDSMYRPFVKKKIYFFKEFNEEQYQLPKLFPTKKTKNVVMMISSTNPIFSALISQYIPELKTVIGGGNSGTSVIPLHTYLDGETQSQNLTAFGKEIFEAKYGTVTDEEIFYYCYAVLNCGQYKEKYRENLKVDLPRIPLLENFRELSALGRELAQTHLNYEEAEKFPLELYEIPQKIQHDEATLLALKRFEKLNIKLQVKKEEGLVILDDKHILKGIPKEAFDYKIGSKSPIEWVCSDNCFSPYKYDMKEENEIFLSQIDDYNWQEVKAHLLDLIPRLVTVSIKTNEIFQKIDELFSE